LPTCKMLAQIGAEVTAAQSPHTTRCPHGSKMYLFNTLKTCCHIRDAEVDRSAPTKKPGGLVEADEAGRSKGSGSSFVIFALPAEVTCHPHLLKYKSRSVLQFVSFSRIRAIRTFGTLVVLLLGIPRSSCGTCHKDIRVRFFCQKLLRAPFEREANGRRSNALLKTFEGKTVAAARRSFSYLMP